MSLPGEVPAGSHLQEQRLDVLVSEGSMPALLVHPQEQAGPHPAVILLGAARETVHGNEHMEDLAQRFAAKGYLALAPNLYWRTEPPALDDGEGLLKLLFDLDDSQLVEDLSSAAARLRGTPECNGRVGLAGFCTGGRQALLAACSSSVFDAAVDCWGGFVDRATFDEVTIPTRPVPIIDRIGDLTCPLLAVGGTEDDNPSPSVLAELARRCEQHGHTYEVELFENAGHAFLNDRRETYRAGPAHSLWEKMLAFLDQHLRMMGKLR